MTLRARVALLVAAVVTVVVAAVGWSAVRSARAELTEEVDIDLLERAAVVVAEPKKYVWSVGHGWHSDWAAPVLQEDPLGSLVSFDAYARVVVTDLDAAGGVILGGEVMLTIGDDIGSVVDVGRLEKARSSGLEIETVSVEGQRLRMMTVAADDNVFVQVARPLSEVDRAVADLRSQVLLFGSLSVAAAAAGAWFLAGRAVRPIVRLAETAEQIAQTGELDRDMTGSAAVSGLRIGQQRRAGGPGRASGLDRDVARSGAGEVGRLARSFKAMLEALAASRRQQHRLVMDASHELRTPLTSLRTNIDLLRRCEQPAERPAGGREAGTADGLTDQDRVEILDDVHADSESYRTPSSGDMDRAEILDDIDAELTSAGPAGGLATGPAGGREAGPADGLTAQDRAEILDDVDAELTELTELAAELVDLAADVRSDEEPQLIQMAEVAAPVAERARRRSGREIAVSVERPVPVEGRPDALARAVRNLVDNAVKFSEQGPVEVVVDGGSVTVHDGGPGVPEADRERIFERFNRLDSHRDQPGSGLGLAIVRQVADAHGGTVQVEDSPLGGAAVTLRIPEIDD